MDEFKANLKNLYKFASTWVVFIITTAAAFWITLPLETQVQMQQDFPLLKYGMLIMAFVSFAVARATPQSPKNQEPAGTMLDEMPPQGK